MERFIINDPAQDDKKDIEGYPTCHGFCRLAIAPLEKPAEDKKYDVQHTEADLSLSLRADSTQFDKTTLLAFEMRSEITDRIRVEVTPLFLWEIAKELCVRPVRVGRFRWFEPRFVLQLSGSGLPFGQPGAATQWKKADVIFNYRTWQTIWKPNFLIVSTNGIFTSTEQQDLLDEVDESDCIEVYFIDEFDPCLGEGEELHGGAGPQPQRLSPATRMQRAVWTLPTSRMNLAM